MAGSAPAAPAFGATVSCRVVYRSLALLLLALRERLSEPADRRLAGVQLTFPEQRTSSAVHPQQSFPSPDGIGEKAPDQTANVKR
jgi:hypothetical protein